MTRYQFLAEAHAIMKPKVYLEIGVQLGSSLALAESAGVAIGVDPQPIVTPQLSRDNQIVYTLKADEYFAMGEPVATVDFAFIDGSHLFEDALNDFINLEQHMTGPRSAIFLDDVLPYNQAIAEREQPPGDWTGDVWKLIEVLRFVRIDLKLTLIDVSPTGLLMVQCPFWGREPIRWGSRLTTNYDKIVANRLRSDAVPNYILKRETAIDAGAALTILRGDHA